jgi:NADH:ubiquinone reductase (H+-translocating)
MGEQEPRVVIIGGGFGGLRAATGLRRAPVRVTLIDRRNHHLFQPLLYEVATAALSPADIAAPIRRVLSRQANADVILGEVTAINLNSSAVTLEDGSVIGYDWLIIATGATHSYFGRDAWAPFAPGLKTIDDALEIRRRFLLAFEAADRETDPAARRAELTFVIVGAGPTGVELAGTMCELARRSIPRDYRSVDTTTTRVILVEADDRVLGTFPSDLSERAKRDLVRLGVEVRLNSRVTHIDRDGVLIGMAPGERIEAANVFWAAGVTASPLGAGLGVPLDGSGRVIVEADLSIPGHPNVFVIGDLAKAVDAATGAAAPGIAPAALQMGAFVARLIRRRCSEPMRPQTGAGTVFRYHDKGMLATIGRGKAVAKLKGIHFAGTLAWLLWAFVHILYLIGFRNRLAVMLSWAWAYLIFQRGARLITGDSDVHMRQPRV